MDVTSTRHELHDNTDYSDRRDAPRHSRQSVLPAPRRRHVLRPGTGRTSRSRSATSHRSSAASACRSRRTGARARIEIHPALSGHRFLPLAIPDNVITKVQVRYIDQCTGTEIRQTDLAPLPDGRPDGYHLAGRRTLWGVKSARATPRSATRTVGRPRAHELYDPSMPGEYLPIGERGAGREPPDIDLDTLVRPARPHVRRLLPPALADPDLERRQPGHRAADQGRALSGRVRRRRRRVLRVLPFGADRLQVRRLGRGRLGRPGRRHPTSPPTSP